MRLLCNAVIGALVLNAIEEGYRVELSNQDGNGLHLYAVPDNGERKPGELFDFWVRLQPENDTMADIIIDFSTQTAWVEYVVAPAQEYAAQLDKLTG